MYTLLTTICAGAVGLGLFLWIAPGNLPLDVIGAGAAQVPENLVMLRITIISYLLFQTIFCNHTYKPMYCL